MVDEDDDDPQKLLGNQRKVPLKIDTILTIACEYTSLSGSRHYSDPVLSGSSQLKVFSI